MSEITREMYIQATGFEPVDDDLERCNCLKAGQAGHHNCGWNTTYNLPCFMAGPNKEVSNG